MAFGGFGGFGQNNNTQQSGGFGSGGGFGQTGNSTGFGSSTSGGFGQQANTGSSLFGGNQQQQQTGSGFGSSGFGSTGGNAFGANKTGFGSTATTGSTGGGLFGGNTQQASSGFGSGGGFGSTTTNTFGGGGSSGGGLFGSSGQQNKPAFGSGTTGGSSLFGGGTTGTASTGFGSTGGFGGGAGGNDPPGTGNTPFQAYTEKETTSNTTNSFQNIAFQDPYKKWSAEELRLADYAQGRRQGNPSGAGAFGQSSGFGGFGSTSQPQQQTGFGAAAKPAGGLFGSSSNTTTGTGFGQTGSGTGFGASTTTGGGLFGSSNTQQKPAGGLFGGSGTTQTQQSGGVFGSGSTGGGFGGASTGTGFGASSTTTGGGLFGNSNTQQKPAGTGFSFGNAGNTGGSGFGSGTTTGGGFGSTGTGSTGGGLFGGNNNTQQQQNSTGGGLFGSSSNTQQGAGGFGGGFGQQNQSQQSGGGLFGNKPATTGGGLFGGSTGGASTGGGLFGNAGNQQQQQQQQGSAFGSGGTTGGGLFGNKPATTGGGLFGGSTTQQNPSTGGGLFGGGGMANNQNQQPSTGGGLFGGANTQTQQKSGGLFGNSTQSTGGGLFGNSTQGQGSSLFGGSTQQQQGQGMGNSLLGNSQQGGNAPQGLTANLNDVSAYGSPGLFSGVGGNEVANPGPLATSLNGNSKPRRGSILPMYKLNPASASRFNTPQKRGFGFSYSNYGTPGGSPASSISSTPGNGNLGRSLLGASSSSNSLSKSMSTNNLRRTYNAEDSILNPGAFSSSSGARWYGSTGSKKLVINRDIRSDLFSTPQKDKAAIDSNPSSRKLAKKVSFDTANVDPEDGTPVRKALPAPEDSQEETPRQSRPANNGSNGSRTPEGDQAKNNELDIVHEEDNSATPEGNSSLSFDNAPGRYWMSPSMEDIQNMNRMQRQKIDGFTVGRDNVGSIEFKIPVDMSSIDLDEICGGIVQLEPRSATVYPIAAKKPPVGKGLNVPARITLEQSWPRGGRDRRASTDQKRFTKHVERLKRITDTTFESYDKDTGLWVFSVEHFTTYGLDDSDDDDDLDPMDDTAATPEIKAFQPKMAASDDSSMQEDDTFDFGRPRGVPGAFGGQDDVYEDEQPMQQSFLGVSSADSAPRDVQLALEEDYPDQGEEYDMSDDEEMARSSVEQHLAAEHDDVSSEGEQVTKVGTPGGILRARMRAMKDSAGPVKLEVADGDDWTEMLRKTVSPVKRDRQQLREYNDEPARQPRFATAEGGDVDDRKTSIWRKSVAKPNKMEALAASTRMAGADKGRGFATSIDLMNSLFEKPKPMAQSMRASTASKGFPKWPYERQDKTLTMGDEEQAFHDASRPTWGPSETLVLTTGASQRFGQTTRDGAGVLAFKRPHVQTDRQSIRLANFSAQSSKKYLRAQDQFTRVHTVKDVPVASLEVSSVKDMFHNEDQNDPASIQEKRVWELASILFDNIDPSASNASESQARRSALSDFWASLVRESSTKSTGLAATSEEKAVACLSGNRVADACKHLLDGKNFRLGTLVALIGTNDAVKKDMREQLKVWRDSKMLSEFSESIRTIYELLSGNVGVCEGMKGVPAEDRIESFVISNKFGLDWKQAFGLRLWYAIAKEDDLSAAVRKFNNDIEQEREAKPRPWYADQGIKPLWQDDDEESRQDLLWGLLQLYADDNTDLEAVLRPENSQLSPFDMRLSWQLGLALVKTGKVSYGNNATEKADAITLAYASQLISAGEWLEAIFVLMHLSDPDARARAIKEQLCRHAGQIGPESGANFGALTQKLQIPSSWVWEALALHMRSVRKDASGEVECLLRAGSFDEAHRVLTNTVAPRAIIERDYATLSALIAQFDGQERNVSGWSSGGEIYSHFLTLLQHRSKGENTQPVVLERLQTGLHAMNEEVPETDLMRYAAVSDMADETAKEILKLGRKKQDSDLRSKILNLPLTQDRRLAYSMDLSGKRSSEVMSH